jgi:hypothetical protein
MILIPWVQECGTRSEPSAGFSRLIRLPSIAVFFAYGSLQRRRTP